MIFAPDESLLQAASDWNPDRPNPRDSWPAWTDEAYGLGPVVLTDDDLESWRVLAEGIADPCECSEQEGGLR